MNALTSSCMAHPWRTLAAWLALVILAGLQITMHHNRFSPGVIAPQVDSPGYWLAHRPQSETRELVCAANTDETRWILGTAPDTTTDAASGADLVTQIARCYAAKWQIPSSTVDSGNPGSAATASLLEAIPLVSPALLSGWSNLQMALPSDAEVSRAIRTDIVHAERLTLPLTLLLLLFALRNPLLALLPVITGGIVCLIAVGTLAWLAQFFTISIFVITVVTMLGLALGIDYSLLWLKLGANAQGTSAPESLVRVILASAATICCSCAGLLLVPIGIFREIIVGVIVAVIVATLAATTLLQAALRLIPGSLRKPIFTRVSLPPLPRSGQIRHVAFLAVVPLALLIVLCFRASALQLGLSADPIAGPIIQNPIGPISYEQYAQDELVLTQLSTLEIMIARQGDDPATDRVLAYIGKNADIAPVVMLEPYPDSGIDVLRLIVVRPPDSQGAASLVSTLQEQIDTRRFTPGGGVIVLGGPLAVYHEIGSAIENRQLMAAIVTLQIMAIVIYLLFRSLLSALLAVCGSLLAFASAIGALVQFSGPGTSGILLGNVPYIESWVPIVMFCVVVGTGIDYFIFVMSGIIAAPADDPQAIQSGMKQVAPVVITAAAIMVIVFGGFAFGKISAIRQLGTGLAICVFIDAFIVRLYLLPLAASIANHGGYRLSREIGWLSRRIER